MKLSSIHIASLIVIFVVAVAMSLAGNLGTSSAQVGAMPVGTVVEPTAPAMVQSGSEFDVGVVVTPGVNVAGVQFGLDYDQGLLELVSANPTERFDGCYAEYNDDWDVVWTALACSDGHTDDPLVVWHLRFRASHVTEPQEAYLDIFEVALGDDQDLPQFIPAIGDGTMVLIVPGVCGDQNNDGDVNILDAIIDLQIIVGDVEATETQQVLSDLNRDGEINVLDVILTLKHIVGSYTIEGCGPLEAATEYDYFPNSEGSITLIAPGGSEETIGLVGYSAVEVFFEGLNEGDANDDDENGLDEVETEMVYLDLVGYAPLGLVGYAPVGDVYVWLDPHMRSVGGIEETQDLNPDWLDLPPFAAGTADSFFDIFLEIEINGQIFRPDGPIHMTTTITHKPPAQGETYVSEQEIPLLDTSGLPTGLAIGRVTYTPNPVPQHPLPQHPSFSLARGESGVGYGVGYADILGLVPGGPPQVVIPATSLGLVPQDDIDALSYGVGYGVGYDSFGPTPQGAPQAGAPQEGGEHFLFPGPLSFSTRPGAIGLPGSGLNAEALCDPDEVAGDEYTVHLPGTNLQLFDENGSPCATNMGFSLGLRSGTIWTPWTPCLRNGWTMTAMAFPTSGSSSRSRLARRPSPSSA